MTNEPRSFIQDLLDAITLAPTINWRFGSRAIAASQRFTPEFDAELE